jgi:glutamate-1-semialdehyde aminotransferase
VGCAAGLVTLRNLTEQPIAAMDAACLTLRNALERRAAELGLEVVVSGFGSVLGIAFAADPRRHEDDPAALGLASLFHLACANEGVLIGPGGILTVSTTHDMPAIAHAIDGLSSALSAVAQWVDARGRPVG